MRHAEVLPLQRVLMLDFSDRGKPRPFHGEGSPEVEGATPMRLDSTKKKRAKKMKKHQLKKRRKRDRAKNRAK